MMVCHAMTPEKKQKIEAILLRFIIRYSHLCLWFKYSQTKQYGNCDGGLELFFCHCLFQAVCYDKVEYSGKIIIVVYISVKLVLCDSSCLI